MIQSDNERWQAGKKNTDRDDILTLPCTIWIQTADATLSERTRGHTEHALYISTCVKVRNRRTNRCCSYQDSGNCWGQRDHGGTWGGMQDAGGPDMLGMDVRWAAHFPTLFSTFASPEVTQKEINARDTCRSKCHRYVLEKQAWGYRSKHASHPWHRTWMSTILLLPLSTKRSCWLWNVSAWVTHVSDLKVDYLYVCLSSGSPTTMWSHGWHIVNIQQISIGCIGLYILSKLSRIHLLKETFFHLSSFF